MIATWPNGAFTITRLVPGIKRSARQHIGGAKRFDQRGIGHQRKAIGEQQAEAARRDHVVFSHNNVVIRQAARVAPP